MPAIGYFLTFNTYGTWLHGDERGSVDRNHRAYGELRIAPNSQLKKRRRDSMVDEPYTLDERRRTIVLSAIQQHVRYRNWLLWAAHIRESHVHLVVTGNIAPERMLNEFKSYTSRTLNLAGIDATDRQRWARHGSTRHLMDDLSLHHAIRYVVDEQGPPMAVYENKEAQEPRPQGSGSMR